MSTATKTNKAKERRAKRARRTGTRFPGIVADAKALGVNRVSLFRALSGEWNLPGLVARYAELKDGQAVN